MKKFPGGSIRWIISLVTLAGFCAGGMAAENMLVYIGTYTGAKSKGIYAYRMNTDSGALTPVGLVAETPSPSFIAISPNHKFLYAANEVSKFNGKASGSITAYAIDRATGKLAQLNAQSSEGAGPCHLVVDHAGRNVLVANYNAGTVAVLPVKADGSLGEASASIQHKGSSVNKSRQEAPHAHCIVVDAPDRFAYACDLGLDQVLIYKFYPAKGTLAATGLHSIVLKAGSGPRHIAFHPKGGFAYVINELNCTMSVLECERGSGGLTEIQTLSTLPEGETKLPGHSTAEVEVHPSGKFVYGSNRGHDTIVVYAIDPGTGRLTLVEHQPTQGRIPRSFGIDPSGKFLLAANQNSDNVVVFSIDGATGKLKSTGTTIEVGEPVCVKFVPTVVAR